MAQFKIKEMSVEDRPRERLCSLGAQALSNAELLAILIGSGTKERSALRIAEEMTCGEGLYRHVGGGYRNSATLKGWVTPERLVYWRLWNWESG